MLAGGGEMPLSGFAERLAEFEFLTPDAQYEGWRRGLPEPCVYL